MSRVTLVSGELDKLKTNEGARRRLARLAQVREQSRDIAKTVRERATKEKLKQLEHLEKNNKEDFLDRQQKLVERLEKLHADRLQSIGSAHDAAAALNEQEKQKTKPADKSKSRAKAAAKILHKSQQEVFDKKKEILDRKLTARILANERSALKLNKAGSKDLPESQIKGSDDLLRINDLDTTIKSSTNENTANQKIEPNAGCVGSDTNLVEQSINKELSRRDMETQWSVQGLQEWVPNTMIHDTSPIETDSHKTEATEPSKKRDLFAVSDEMPKSLLGDLPKIPPLEAQSKPSLSIVSEFLRTRDDRLPKPKSGFHKMRTEELHGIRDTLFQTRHIGGTDDICKVVDDEAVPMPAWKAANCGFCTFDHLKNQNGPPTINRNMSSVNPNRTRSRSMVNDFHKEGFNLRKFSSPTRYTSEVPKQPQNTPRTVKDGTSKFSSKPTLTGYSVNQLNKRPSVLQYDHNTKSTKDVPLENDRYVAKVVDNDLDAYSLALKESAEILTTMGMRRKENTEQKRGRVAVSRDKVAQEYKDTMAFLATLSNAEKSKPIESAYMDDYQQNKRRQTYQRKLENEFKQVQREANRNATRSAKISEGPTLHNKRHDDKKSSALIFTSEDNGIADEARNSLSDAQALLHHIRQTVGKDSMDKLPKDKHPMKKSAKFSHSVKFDSIPMSYNYTQNVKHTPPTRERPKDYENDRYTKDYESPNADSSEVVQSDCSSDYDVIIQRNGKAKSKSSKEDVRKFIVYKVRDSGDEDVVTMTKKIKNKSKLTADDKAKEEETIVNEENVIGDAPSGHNSKSRSKSPVKNLQTMKDHEQTVQGVPVMSKSDRMDPEECTCLKCKPNAASNHKDKQIKDRTTMTKQPLEWDIPHQSRDCQNKHTVTGSDTECKCSHKCLRDTGVQPSVSAATSVATFKTATSDKSSAHTRGAGGYVKVLDERGEEAGKFYIGASELPKDEAYEIIIQLKRKDGSPKSKDKSCQIDPPIEMQQVEMDADKVTNGRAISKSQISEELRKIALKISLNANLSDNQKNPDVRTPSQCPELSTSSSTAYMSPPEFMLPKFLQYNYVFQENIEKEPTKEKTKKPVIKYVESRKLAIFNKPDSEIGNEVHTSRGTKICRSKKCRSKSTHPISASSASSPTRLQCFHSHNPCCMTLHQTNEGEKPRTSGNPDKCDKKSTREKEECECCKRAKVKYNKQPLYNLVGKHEYKTKNNEPAKNCKVGLSPLVQKYINELLEMSKDGLKGVEIAKLQCSTVSTPGSSVINISSNVDHKSTQDQNNKKNHEDVFTMGKVYPKRKAKQQNILKHHKKIRTVYSNTETSSESPRIEKGLGDIPQPRKNRHRMKSRALYRHKIKSLNISKNIYKYFKSIDPDARKKSIYFTQSPRLTSSDTGPRNCNTRRQHKVKKDNKSHRDRKPSPLKNDTPKSTPPKNLKKTAVRPSQLDLVKKSASAPVTKIKNAQENGPNSPTKKVLMEQKSDNLKMVYSKEEKSKSQVCSKIFPIQHSPPVKDKNCRKSFKSGIVNIPVISDIQPQQNMITDDNLMQIAEEKIQNMERIANLTEKCTKRLSNLAKVLDEVRKNKSNMYNQISSADTSSSDPSLGKNSASLQSKPETENIINLHKKYEGNTEEEIKDKEYHKSNIALPTPSFPGYVESKCKLGNIVSKNDERESTVTQDMEFVPILGDIPKPTQSSFSDSNLLRNHRNQYIDLGNKSVQNNEMIRFRSKPPPALFRANLKSDEVVIPHELSTVLEVDSPMSTRNKKSPINTNIKIKEENQPGEIVAEEPQSITTTPLFPQPYSKIIPQNEDEPRDTNFKPVNLVNKFENQIAKNTIEKELGTVYMNELQKSLLLSFSGPQHETSTEKEKPMLKMIDMKKFNDIMFKPLISIEEYARQYNIAMLDEGSNLDDATQKQIATVEENMNSLNSDGTLPDIVSELLKRNLISEPFNFTEISATNVNVQHSDSSISDQAQFKIKHHKKKVSIDTKTHDVDTSDSMSFASKADLEKAFEELGMGWASSTLKKTKETLALSSSTSTMSSMEHSKYRKFNKLEKSGKVQQIPGMMSDTSETLSMVTENSNYSSLHNSSNDKENQSKINKAKKHSIKLQTSTQFDKPITANDFLTNSLAGKITFAKKEEEDHYSSLYSTKLSIDTSNPQFRDKVAPSDLSLRHNTSKQNARQRTSTPVQLFKSLTFNSSTSSYNNSNGLFSNVDELSSVKGTSVSLKNSSSTEKDELTIPNFSLRLKKSNTSGNSDS